MQIFDFKLDDKQPVGPIASHSRLNLVQGASQDVNGSECAREVLNQLKVNGHRSIVHLFAVERTDNYLVLVLELCSGGSLSHFLTIRWRINEDDAREIFRQIFLALDFCHGQGICIRDIKPDNILFHDSQRKYIKICDFGLSKDMDGSLVNSMVGTKHYVAPEVVEAYHKGSHYDGKAADIWSSGVTLYKAIYSSFPFPQAPKPTRQDVGNLTFPETPVISENLEDLLTGMLQAEPADRYTAPQLMAHPWLQDNVLEENALNAVVYNDQVRSQRITLLGGRQVGISVYCNHIFFPLTNSGSYENVYLV